LRENLLPHDFKQLLLLGSDKVHRTCAEAPRWRQGPCAGEQRVRGGTPGPHMQALRVAAADAAPAGSAPCARTSAGLRWETAHGLARERSQPRASGSGSGAARPAGGAGPRGRPRTAEEAAARRARSDAAAAQGVKRRRRKQDGPARRRMRGSPGAGGACDPAGGVDRPLVVASRAARAPWPTHSDGDARDDGARLYQHARAERPPPGGSLGGGLRQGGVARRARGHGRARQGVRAFVDDAAGSDGAGDSAGSSGGRGPGSDGLASGSAAGWTSEGSASGDGARARSPARSGEHFTVLGSAGRRARAANSGDEPDSSGSARARRGPAGGGAPGGRASPCPSEAGGSGEEDAAAPELLDRAFLASERLGPDEARPACPPRAQLCPVKGAIRMSPQCTPVPRRGRERPAPCWLPRKSLPAACRRLCARSPAACYLQAVRPDPCRAAPAHAFPARSLLSGEDKA